MCQTMQPELLVVSDRAAADKHGCIIFVDSIG